MLFFAGPAVAADPAIGRLNQAGFSTRSHCTFVAVDARTAVTARHCVEQSAPADLTLLYGYERMGWVAVGSVTRIVPLEGDAAALCLSAAPPATIGQGPALARGDRVAVVGYGEPRVHVQAKVECTVLAMMGRYALLDCPASKGSSGGPVMGADGGVAAVMSRTARASSVAAALPKDVAAACR